MRFHCLCRFSAYSFCVYVCSNEFNSMSDPELLNQTQNELTYTSILAFHKPLAHALDNHLVASLWCNPTYCFYGGTGSLLRHSFFPHL